jgi:hypothetical protein
MLPTHMLSKIFLQALIALLIVVLGMATLKDEGV